MSQKIFHPLKPKDAPAADATETDNPAPSEAPAQPTYKPGLATGDLCYIAADHLGLLGPQVAVGLYQLRCPWASEHGAQCKQRDGIFDNSTLLFLENYELNSSERAATGDGVPLDGGVLCMHEHSAGPHKGVPLNASVFLSYARSCGAPLPDRGRYEAEAQPEQVGEFSLTGDALESYAAAEPPAQPASFTEFVKKHQPSMSMFRWKEGHWLIMSGLENALTMRESLILAPPRTGRSMLATIFFPAWLMLVKGKQNVVVVCESATAAKDRHREILEKFPAIEPFVGLVLGKTVDAQPRLQFRGPYTSFTGQGFDAIVIDPPRGSDPKLAGHYAVLSSCLAPGGFIATITNREGEGDFAQALINFGGGWGQRLQAHLFPDMIPTDIDRTTDTYFWQYNQGLPSYYGAKDIAAAPNSIWLAEGLRRYQAGER